MRSLGGMSRRAYIHIPIVSYIYKIHRCIKYIDVRYIRTYILHHTHTHTNICCIVQLSTKGFLRIFGSHATTVNYLFRWKGSIIVRSDLERSPHSLLIETNRSDSCNGNNVLSFIKNFLFLVSTIDAFLSGVTIPFGQLDLASSHHFSFSLSFPTNRMYIRKIRVTLK